MVPCDFLIKSTDQPTDQSRQQCPFDEGQPHKPVETDPGTPHQGIDHHLVPSTQGWITVGIELS